MAKNGKPDPSALSALPAGSSTHAPRSEGPRPARRAKGLPVPRRTTRAGQTAAEVFAEVEWTRRPARISGADGEVVFKMDDAEVPAAFSQLATDIAVSKYFRKAGVRGTRASGDLRPPARPPRRPHHPRRRREVRRLLRHRRGRRRLRGRARRTCWCNQYGAFNSPGVVQLRPLPRVRHRGLGRELCRASRRPATDRRDRERLRAPAVLGLLHPGGRRRPDEHLRPGQERGAPLQVRLGHGHQLQQIRGKQEKLSGGGTSAA